MFPNFCKTECTERLILCIRWHIGMHSWHRQAYECILIALLGP